MYTEWTKHLETQEEKDRFLSQLQAAQPVMEILCKLLDEKSAALDRSFLSLQQYQLANWPYITAHKNGMASAYEAVKTLVTIKE